MDNGASSYLRFLNGDESGFDEIVRIYENGLIMFINSFTNDYHIAEEAADEVFLKLYVKKPKFKGECSFKTWIYAIGRNTAVNYVKKHKKSGISSLDDYFYLSDNTDIEAEYISGKEDKIILHKAIRRLNQEYAQALYLMFFEELDVPEIAEIMGKSNRQISNIIYRAKIALKTELEKEGSNG